MECSLVLFVAGHSVTCTVGAGGEFLHQGNGKAGDKLEFWVVFASSPEGYGLAAEACAQREAIVVSKRNRNRAASCAQKHLSIKPKWG